MSDNEFLSPPPWRNRTTAGRRGKAIGLTFTWYVIAGAALMVLILGVASWVGAPGWLLLAGWLIPTIGAAVWALGSTTPGLIAEIESQSWTEYVIRFVMIGSEQPRPRPARLVTAVLFGAPVVYGAITLIVLTLIGFG